MIKVTWNYNNYENSKDQEDPIYLENRNGDLSISKEEADKLRLEVKP